MGSVGQMEAAQEIALAPERCAAGFGELGKLVVERFEIVQRGTIVKDPAIAYLFSGSS